MLISLFAIILAFSITLIALGLYFEDAVFQVIGFIFLILISLTLTGVAVTGIEYTDGTDTTTTYSYTSINGTDQINNTVTASSDTYQEYNNKIYGVMLLFVAVFGMIFSISDMRGKDDGFSNRIRGRINNED